MVAGSFSDIDSIVSEAMGLTTPRLSFAASTTVYTKKKHVFYSQIEPQSFGYEWICSVD